MMKKSIIILSILFLGHSVSAETIAYKLKGNLKLEGSANIEVNATPLVDDKTIESSKDKLITIINYANNQSQIVKKKNKNRKPRTKFKGGPEEIFEKFANSVVYIENQKDRGTGSGFIINHKGLKVITNWHVVETAKNVTICLRTDD